MSIAVPERTPVVQGEVTDSTYQTYNTRPMGGGNFSFRGNVISRTFQRLPDQPRGVQLPSAVPQFLGRRDIIFGTWVVAMILIGWDEWHNYGVLPRPTRFWWGSMFYGILIGVAMVDIMVPLASALAIAYTFVLAYQTFGGDTPGAQWAAKQKAKK